MLILLLAAASLAGAWALEGVGYTPCELCLKERIPYELGIVAAALTAFAAWRGHRRAVLAGFGVLILVFVASTALGLYHVGVEWRFWPGPAECSGTAVSAPNVTDFMEQLRHVSVVRCDQPALTILGLSLAGWNVVVSIALVALSNAGLLLIGSPGRRPGPALSEP